MQRSVFTIRSQTVIAGLIAVAVATAIAPACHAQPLLKRRTVLPGPSDVPPRERRAVQPAGPEDYKSPHFLLHTDLPPKEARELLNRLETMLNGISGYWGQPPRGIIECFVVRDVGVWPKGVLDPGLAKIQQGAGITHVETKNIAGKTIDARAVVYAVADRGTPQHEAVHAYCGQTFGRTGPLWYSEGMAEMGQYWRKGDDDVHCHPYVIEYLRRSPPKPVAEIVAEDGVEKPGPANVVAAAARTGDSWQNYAWRWALCHLLEKNPNYRDRFRPLGLGYLNAAPVSFEDTFGGMLAEIEFEYRFFLSHIEEGYSVELCRWNWNRPFREPTGGSVMRTQINAKGGWQPSGALVKRGQEYEYSASGTWRTTIDGKERTADGGPGGAARLEGVIFHDYQLSEPFWLSSHGTFSPPVDGQLFLRCADKWNELADNVGVLTIKLKNAGQGNHLPKPTANGEEPGPKPSDAE